MFNRKKAWIKIVEAFVAILLIVGVLLFVINKGYIGKNDSSEKIYEIQKTLLRAIELDDDLRTEILIAKCSDSGCLKNNPINYDDSDFPDDTKTKINNFFQDYPYLECSSKICELDEICTLNYYQEKNVYAQSVAISATSSTYAPRQLKIFCWEK